MAVNYSSTLQTNRLNVMNDATNGKTWVAGSGGGTAGQLVIGTSTLSGATGVLATITLQNPAFSISAPTATLLGTPLSVAASGSGTAALAEIRNSSGTTIISGLTVSATSGDIVLNTVTITSGQTVTVTSGTITTN